MKNTILIISTIVLFISLILLPVYLKPVPEQRVITHSDGSTELFYKVDYLTFDWSITVANGGTMIKKETMYNALYGEKISLYVLLALVGMAALYTAIYVGFFQFVSMLLHRLRA